MNWNAIDDLIYLNEESNYSGEGIIPSPLFAFKSVILYRSLLVVFGINNYYYSIMWYCVEIKDVP